MYAVPSLKTDRINELSDVVVANVPRNFIQIGSAKNPTIAVRASPPYNKTFSEAGPDEDCGLTIEVCDARQEIFFQELEKEVVKQCKATFDCDLPVKTLTRDGTVRLKCKRDVDITDTKGKKYPLVALGQNDKVAIVAKISCLWKSDSAMGASVRVVRILIVEHAVEFVPEFLEE